MVNMAAAEHAAVLSKENPDLAVGMHFVLTLGRPLSSMPGLARDGELGKWIWEMAEQGTLPLDEIAQELQCQFGRFVSLFGRLPTHLDSHHHVHMFPQIFPIVEAFAKDQGIPVRIDRDEIRRGNIALCGAKSTDGFDSSFYGETVSEALFVQTLDNATQRGDRSVEIMTHPAFIDNTLLASKYCYPRLAELDVLTSASLKTAITERGFRLGSFKDL
jgi:predicted glycoside hydrolase/deacetylase ChbG (UPF0249 family)